MSPALRDACLPYAAFGVTIGVWQVLLAEVLPALGVGPGALGIALTVGMLASLPVMLAAGRVADREGTRRLHVLSSLVAAAGLAGYAVVGSVAGLVLVTVVFLVGFGGVDVAVNARAVALEQSSGRSLLAPAYAAFSGGGAVAALSTGAALGAGVPYPVLHLVGAAVLLAALAVVRRDVRPPHVDVALPRLPRSPLVALLAVAVGLAFVTQGTLEQWSTVYLRVELELPELLGASGIAVFHVAMLIGRLGGVALQRRLPRQALLTGAGIGVAVGMSTALATTALPLVLLGLLVVGLSTAVVAPVAVSLAGDAAGQRAGAVTGVVVTTGYAMSLLGPAVVGGVGELASLRVGLGVVVAAGVLLAGVGRLAAARVPARER